MIDEVGFFALLEALRLIRTVERQAPEPEYAAQVAMLAAGILGKRSGMTREKFFQDARAAWDLPQQELGTLYRDLLGGDTEEAGSDRSVPEEQSR